MSVLVRLLAVAAIAAMMAACNHEPRVSEVDYPATEGGKIYFLTQADGANGDAADLVGELELVGGCLQIRHDQVEGGVPMTVVWPEGFGLGVSDEPVTVRDGSGAVVTQVGERTLLGGSGGSDDDRLGGCDGPFWYAGAEVMVGDATPAVFD